MKKIIIFIILIILLCFLIPILFTQKFETIQIFSEEKKVEELKVDTSYNYNDYTTVKLLHTSSNEIEEVNLDEYMCNVVSAEIPAKYNIEALKAQAVVARTYTIYTIIRNAGKHGEADICDSSTCCQAWISKENRLSKWAEDEREEYWNKIVEAVNTTIGEIVTYNGEIINAFYHANSGGKTEMASGVWGRKRLSILTKCRNSTEKKDTSNIVQR